MTPREHLESVEVGRSRRARLSAQKAQAKYTAILNRARGATLHARRLCTQVEKELRGLSVPGPER
jgi:hypothetical protein